MNGSAAFLRLAAVGVGFPAASFALGWFVLGRAAWLDRTERFAAVWGVGFGLLALGQFLAFATGGSAAAFHLGMLVVLAIVALARSRRATTAMLSPSGDPPPVGLWLLGLAHLAAIQCVLPVYLGGNWEFDWYMHYEEALVFVGRLPATTSWGEGRFTLASRTPFFNLVTAAVMSVAGDPFWVYQSASVLTNGAVFLALALVVRDLFGPRAARLGLLLAALNLWILHGAWFTWTKMLTAYYLLLGLHFYLRWLRAGAGDPATSRRLFLAFWVSSLLGFMTHQVGAVYLGVLLAHAAVSVLRGRARRPGVGEVVVLGLSALAIVAPWHLWLARNLGAREVLLSTPTTTMPRKGSSPSPLPTHLVAYAQHLTRSVLPVDQVRTILGGPWSPGRLFIEISALYFCQWPGLLTLSLTAFLASQILGRQSRHSGVLRAPCASGLEAGAVLSFALLGALVALALLPDPIRYGVAHNVFFPSTLVLAVWAWGVFSRSDSRWKPIVGAGIAAEFLVMFWLHLAWIFLHLRYERIGTDSNWLLKQAHHVVLLYDVLGPAVPVAFAACIVIQARLCWLLADAIRPGRETALASPSGA